MDSVTDKSTLIFLVEFKVNYVMLLRLTKDPDVSVKFMYNYKVSYGS